MEESSKKLKLRSEGGEDIERGGNKTSLEDAFVMVEHVISFPRCHTSEGSKQLRTWGRRGKICRQEHKGKKLEDRGNLGSFPRSTIYSPDSS